MTQEAKKIYDDIIAKNAASAKESIFGNLENKVKAALDNKKAELARTMFLPKNK